MTTSATSSAVSVIATGDFTAGGVDHVGSVDNLVFSRGTVQIRHSPATGKQSLSPKTCLLTASLHGTYKILSGTGKYAGISGRGTYKLGLLAIAARSEGRCSQTKPPVTFREVVTASGPVRM